VKVKLDHFKNNQNEECSQQKNTNKQARGLQHKCPGMSTSMKRKEKDMAEDSLNKRGGAEVSDENVIFAHIKK